jgi:hypothetical protein
MMMKQLAWFFGVAILFLLIKPAMADSMRCGSHIIDAGGLHAPTMDEVLEKCGEPDERLGATWVYKDQDRLTRRLHFNANGELNRIETE